MAVDPYENILHPEKVLLLVRDFFDKHFIFDEDVIEHSASVIENAPYLIASLGKAVGWADRPIDDEAEDIALGDYDEDNPDYYDD